MTPDVLQAGRSPTAATSSAAAQDQGSRGQISSDFQTFLRMLTAQIQNQDPLNPTPSDEFAVQLATFSGVEQQVRTNELLAALGGQFGAGGLGHYAGWIGREARAAAPASFIGIPLTLVPAPASGADRAQLVVRDASGREVERREIPVAAVPIRWEGVGETGGTYPHGIYSFELVSFANDTPIESSTVETYGRVLEARIENGQAMLVLESGAVVPASTVKALRDPA